ncbi:MAG: hypothetical protein EOM05_12425 [Clostridia bacterium]|nr:hypothetical protein [Clostridia bacterium]
MNFYIGDSIEKLDIKERNIELNDDLFQFIYDERNQLGNSLQVLFEIDQFSDVVIPQSKVKELEIAFMSILDSKLLVEYDDHDEAKNTIVNLIIQCKEACNMKVGLISIGD